MKTLIEEIGHECGMEAVAKRGIGALEFAIFALGGVDATARALKMTRQHFTQTLRKKPLSQWKLEHVAALADALHISVDLLRRTDKLVTQAAPAGPAARKRPIRQG